MDAVSELYKILTNLFPARHVPIFLHEPCMDHYEEKAVVECVRSGFVSSVGEQVDHFESKLSQLVEAKHTICTSSGTTALHSLLYALGVKQDQEVLCPALTFVGTANAIAHTGASPHFIDCDETTLGIDASKLKKYLRAITKIKDGKLINKKTSRIISTLVIVHVFGHSVNMEALFEVGDEFGINIIEDAAESMGSTFNNKALGAQLCAGITSFNGNKIITTGGGGAIFTNNDALAAKVRHLTTTAKKPHPYVFSHDEVAFNYRMPNINAALGLAQLAKLETFLEKKRKIAEIYQKSFFSSKYWQFVEEPKRSKSNYWLNAVKLKQPSFELLSQSLEKLNSGKIHVRPVWTPLHKLPMFVDCPRSDLKITEKISQQVINLPSSPQLLELMNA